MEHQKLIPPVKVHLSEKGVVDLMLCESVKLVLKPNTLYRFTVDSTCADCLKIELEGKTP